MNFNWNDHEQELNAKIEEVVKKHNDFINSDFGKFMAHGQENYGAEWTSTLWWNDHTKEIEVYSDEPQQLIDFYHFSEARTRVIIRHSGEDITKRFKFNPLYRDIFDDDRLKKATKKLNKQE